MEKQILAIGYYHHNQTILLTGGNMFNYQVPATEKTNTKFVIDKINLEVVTFNYSKRELDENGKPTGKYRQSLTMEIQIKDLPVATQKQIMKTIMKALEE